MWRTAARWPPNWPVRKSCPVRESRPVEFHHQPLAEPSVRFSSHSAPIRRTYRSCRVASERRDRAAQSRACLKLARPSSVTLKALELTDRPGHERLIDISQQGRQRRRSIASVIDHLATEYPQKVPQVTYLLSKVALTLPSSSFSANGFSSTSRGP